MIIFRFLFGVILGYVAIALIKLVGMTVGVFGMGAERVFVGDSWQLSHLWNIFAITVSAIAAFFGGFVATWWGGRTLSGYGLAGVVLAFGLLTMVAIMNRETPSNPPPRPIPMQLRDWGMTDQYATPPTWLLASAPIIGMVGVVVGTIYLGRRKSSSMVQR